MYVTCLCVFTLLNMYIHVHVLVQFVGWEIVAHVSLKTVCLEEYICSIVVFFSSYYVSSSTLWKLFHLKILLE